MKLLDGDAWVLVVPDASAPIVHIFAEDVSSEAAALRARRFVDILSPAVSGSEATMQEKGSTA